MAQGEEVIYCEVANHHQTQAHCLFTFFADGSRIDWAEASRSFQSLAFHESGADSAGVGSLLKLPHLQNPAKKCEPLAFPSARQSGFLSYLHGGQTSPGSILQVTSRSCVTFVYRLGLHSFIMLTSVPLSGDHHCSRLVVQGRGIGLQLMVRVFQDSCILLKH